MELRKEFQDIYDKNLRALNGNYLNRSEALYEAVKDCQELADRPPRKLSDVEIRSLVENHGQVWETKNLMDQLCRRVEAATLACEELADRPMKELTEKEIDKVFRETTNSIPGAQSTKFARALEAAIHAKQREPETVKFRAARPKNGGPIQMVRVLAEINDMWEWLEPAQEFEVKV